MPTKKLTMDGWLASMDEAAAEHEAGSYVFWGSHNVVLAVWGGGGIPGPDFDPAYNAALRPFMAAVRALGYDRLKAVLGERQRLAWIVEYPNEAKAMGLA